MIPAMGLRFRRSIKILPGVRLNFSTRGISTSIGVRGAHVTVGKTGVRTTVGLPGSGLSYTHLEKARRNTAVASQAGPAQDTDAAPGSAWRGFLWIGLIVAALGYGLGGRMPTGSETLPLAVHTAAQPAGGPATPVADAARTAEIDAAVFGVARLRRSVPNSKALTLSRVRQMPGTICYEIRLQNSRGVAYVRTAMQDDAGLKISGTPGFATLWSRRCAMDKPGRDITTDVNAVMRHAAVERW